MLKIENASLIYKHTPVFAEVNLQLPPNQWIALLGSSGIGKTSLLKMIAGLLERQKDTEIEFTSNILPHHIAYIPQQDSLLPWLNALDNTLLKLRIRHHSRKAMYEEKIKAKRWLTELGLADAYALYPHQLSGGMKQRVALARTLMEDRPLILMDEPFSSLDTMTRYRLHNISVTALRGKTVLFITHDPLEALRLADVIYIMAGHPARLHKVFELQTDCPRDLRQPELMKVHDELLSLLMGDHHETN